MEQVKSIEFATIYVHDFSSALAFYRRHFGYEVKHPMGEVACWGTAGGAGIYLEGGHFRSEASESSARASVVFRVESASKFFEQLRSDGVPLLHSQPYDVGKGCFWFQFRDPGGNILEILGGP